MGLNVFFYQRLAEKKMFVMQPLWSCRSFVLFCFLSANGFVFIFIFLTFEYRAVSGLQWQMTKPRRSKLWKIFLTCTLKFMFKICRNGLKTFRLRKPLGSEMFFFFFMQLYIGRFKLFLVYKRPTTRRLTRCSVMLHIEIEMSSSSNLKCILRLNQRTYFKCLDVHCLWVAWWELI